MRLYLWRGKQRAEGGGNDQGIQSGNRGCEDVVYNNGDIESYIHSSDYMLVVKGKEKQLYRIIE